MSGSSAAPPLAPGALPLMGHFMAWRRDPLRLLTRAQAQCGDVVSLSFRGFECVLLSRPEHIASVHAGSTSAFEKAQGGYVFPRAFGNGLLSSRGDFWRRQRSLAQPAFHRRKIATYAAAIVKLAEETVAQWRDGEVVDIHAHMSALTQRIAGMTLFGVDTSRSAGEVSAALDSINRAVNTEGRSLLLERLPAAVRTMNRRRADAAIATLDRLADQILQARAAEQEPRDDLLSMLAGAVGADGEAMSPRQLRDEIVTLYLAGHETTANTLSWVWYLLSSDQLAAERLASELDDVLAGRPASPGDLGALSFTRAVIDEALRLYPPVWQVFRMAARDARFDGFLVRAGTGIMMSQWLTHHDGRWFGDPLRFDPDRWLDGRTDGLPRYAFFPFGGGPRVCLGSAFAQMETALVLATVARRVQLRLAGAPVRPVPYITLRPGGGIPVQVKRL